MLLQIQGQFLPIWCVALLTSVGNYRANHRFRCRNALLAVALQRMVAPRRVFVVSPFFGPKISEDQKRKGLHRKSVKIWFHIIIWCHSKWCHLERAAPLATPLTANDWRRKVKKLKNQLLQNRPHKKLVGTNCTLPHLTTNAHQFFQFLF